MPQTSRSTSIISLLLIAVMSGLMTFQLPGGNEPTTVATVATSDIYDEDSMSSGEEGAEDLEREEMSDAQFFKIAFILIGSIVCFFISLKTLVNFWIIVTGLAAFGLIFTLEDLSISAAVIVSLIMLAFSGLFGGKEDG